MTATKIEFVLLAEIVVLSIRDFIIPIRLETYSAYAGMAIVGDCFLRLQFPAIRIYFFWIRLPIGHICCHCPWVNYLLCMYQNLIVLGDLSIMMAISPLMGLLDLLEWMVLLVVDKDDGIGIDIFNSDGGSALEGNGEGSGGRQYVRVGSLLMFSFSAPGFGSNVGALSLILTNAEIAPLYYNISKLVD